MLQPDHDPSATRADPAEQLSGRCALCHKSHVVRRSNTVSRVGPFGEVVRATACTGTAATGKGCPGVVYLFPSAPAARPDYPTS